MLIHWPTHFLIVSHIKRVGGVVFGQFVFSNTLVVKRLILLAIIGLVCNTLGVYVKALLVITIVYAIL
jgi:hypothetical protein